MKKLGVEEVVYRDIEKFYRVLGYYEGLEVKPLELHEKFIDQNLESSLRNEETYIRRLQFLIRMTEVIAAKQTVYKTEKPEASLVYSLFSEGIQSLITLRDLTALDIKEWGSLVRQTLIDFDSSQSKDLASILWRNPSRNIRARVYNSLFDSDQYSESDDDATARGRWHSRDKDWDLPNGDTVERSTAASMGLNPQTVSALRSQILSPSVLSELPQDLRIESDEVTKLADELGSLDQDHVDFNLMNWTFQVLKSSTDATHPEFLNASESLQSLTQGIVARFQPSLIVLLLNELDQLTTDLLKPLRSTLEQVISSTLKQPNNQKRLITSLKDAERAKVSQKLLPYLDPKQFGQIVDFYLAHDDRDGLLDFLKVILSRDLAHETILFGWGEDRLSAVLPTFRRLHWKGKYDFLKRALKSPYPKIVKASSYYLDNISLDSTTALKIYGDLPDEVKEIWLKVLTETAVMDSWKAFIQNLVERGLWSQSHDRMVGSRLLAGWAQLATKYFGPSSLSLLRPWIEARQWIFWSKFPWEREACLNAILSQKDLWQDTNIQDVVRAQSRLSRQDPTLKNRLEAAVRRFAK